MRPVDILLAVAVNLAWGLNFAVTKLGLGEMPPMLLVALRYALTALLLSPWLKWPRGQFLQVAAISFTLGFLHFALMFTGLSGIDASVAAIAVQIQVPFSALLAFLFFRDRIGWRKAAGGALAIGGIVLIAGAPHEAPDPFYLSLTILAALCWAVSAIQVKRLGAIDTLTLNAWIALLATPQLLLGSALLEGDRWGEAAEAGWWGWGSVVYMAVAVTVFGYGLWYRLLQRYPVTTVMPLSLLAPTFGVAAGIFILGEPATLEKFIGGGLTLLGVAIVILTPPERAKPETGSERSEA
ncbi:MAG: DMT family transporter [Thalassobaculum sp.]